MGGQQRVHGGRGADDAHMRLQRARAERARQHAAHPHHHHAPPTLLQL